MNPNSPLPPVPDYGPLTLLRSNSQFPISDHDRSLILGALSLLIQRLDPSDQFPVDQLLDQLVDACAQDPVHLERLNFLFKLFAGFPSSLN
jgi:hypothetical protein